MAKSNKGSSAEMDKQTCGICNKTKSIVKWCPVCEYFLCKSRDQRHAKIAPSHLISKIENYLHLPSSIVFVSNFCPMHKNEYRQYCRNHEELCCEICARDSHKYCADLSPIDTALENIRSQSFVTQLEQDILEINENIKSGKSKIQNQMSELIDSEKRCLSEIAKMRKTINKNLDEIEYQIREEIKSKMLDLRKKLKLLLNEFEDMSVSYRKMKDDMLKVKEYGSIFQLFACAKDMSVRMNGDVQSLGKPNKIEFILVRVNISEQIQSIATVNSFGEVIEVEKEQVSLPLLSRYMTQPQDTVPHVKTTIYIPESRVQGCEIMPDGRLLFTDAMNKRLVIRPKDNDNYDFIKLSGKPFDVSHTIEENVCISFADERKIQIVDISTKTVLNSSFSFNKCYGIVKNMQQLYLRTTDDFMVSKNNVVLVNFEGERIMKLKIPGQYIWNIPVKGNKIKCTDRGSNSIKCYTQEGGLIWEFKDTSILRNPAGIAEDKKRNAYVAGTDTDNVVVISPDGNKCREILSKDDGLKEPFALCINLKRKELLVCNLSGTAFLCNIT